MTVKKGDKIKVHYTGTLDNGEVFDTSEKRGTPIEFEVGKGMVIPGFDKAVIGMKKGEEKEVKLEPVDAYGDARNELIQKVPREQFPKEPEPKTGLLIHVGLSNGQKLPAKIVAVDDKEITIDLNHPLAGKNLNFKLKVISIGEAEKTEASETKVSDKPKKEEKPKK